MSTCDYILAQERHKLVLNSVLLLSNILTNTPPYIIGTYWSAIHLCLVHHVPIEQPSTQSVPDRPSSSPPSHFRGMESEFIAQSPLEGARSLNTSARLCEEGPLRG
jgi:hypothetical protein